MASSDKQNTQHGRPEFHVSGLTVVETGVGRAVFRDLVDTEALAVEVCYRLNKGLEAIWKETEERIRDARGVDVLRPAYFVDEDKVIRRASGQVLYSGLERDEAEEVCALLNAGAEDSWVSLCRKRQMLREVRRGRQAAPPPSAAGDPPNATAPPYEVRGAWVCSTATGKCVLDCTRVEDAVTACSLLNQGVPFGVLYTCLNAVVAEREKRAILPSQDRLFCVEHVDLDGESHFYGPYDERTANAVTATMREDAKLGNNALDFWVHPLGAYAPAPQHRRKTRRRVIKETEES